MEQERQSVIKRVDRLVVRVQSPEPLFSTLQQRLLLPVAWPIGTNPFFTSGGLFLGNLNLELLQAGAPVAADQLYGLVFELTPYELSLPELDARGIPHTPPMPFYVVDEMGWQVTAWTSVYLGGLVPSNPAGKLFFPFSVRLGKERWEQSSHPTHFNRNYGLPFIYDKVYPVLMTAAVQYNPAWRAENIRAETDHTGLDVQGVYEVTLGARNFERAYARWSALLAPCPEIAPGVWELPEGLHLRLVAADQDGLQRMVWQVASLNRAVQFLHRYELLGEDKDGMQTICADKVGGLDIRLVQ